MIQTVTLPTGTSQQYIIDLDGQDAVCREWLTPDGLAIVITHPSGNPEDDRLTVPAMVRELSTILGIKYNAFQERQCLGAWLTEDGRLPEYFHTNSEGLSRRLFRLGDVIDDQKIRDAARSADTETVEHCGKTFIVRSRTVNNQLVVDAAAIACVFRLAYARVIKLLDANSFQEYPLIVILPNGSQREHIFYALSEVKEFLRLYFKDRQARRETFEQQKRNLKPSGQRYATVSVHRQTEFQKIISRLEEHRHRKLKANGSEHSIKSDKRRSALVSFTRGVVMLGCSRKWLLDAERADEIKFEKWKSPLTGFREKVCLESEIFRLKRKRQEPLYPDRIKSDVNGLWYVLVAVAQEKFGKGAVNRQARTRPWKVSCETLGRRWTKRCPYLPGGRGIRSKNRRGCPTYLCEEDVDEVVKNKSAVDRGKMLPWAAGRMFPKQIHKDEKYGFCSRTLDRWKTSCPWHPTGRLPVSDLPPVTRANRGKNTQEGFYIADLDIISHNIAAGHRVFGMPDESEVETETAERGPSTAPPVADPASATMTPELGISTAPLVADPIPIPTPGVSTDSPSSAVTKPQNGSGGRPPTRDKFRELIRAMSDDYIKSDVYKMKLAEAIANGDSTKIEKLEILPMPRGYAKYIKREHDEYKKTLSPKEKIKLPIATPALVRFEVLMMRKAERESPAAKSGVSKG